MRMRWLVMFAGRAQRKRKERRTNGLDWLCVGGVRLEGPASEEERDDAPRSPTGRPSGRDLWVTRVR